MRFKPLILLLFTAFSAVSFARMPLPLMDQEGRMPKSTKAATPIETEVEHVLDADTIRVSAFDTDVRIASIDAPETQKKRPLKPGQPFAQAATTRLNDLLGSYPRRVQLACYEQDKYGRHVCDVIVKGKSVSAILVSEGFAWANTASNGRYLRSPALVLLQQQAQQKKLGIWSDNKSPVEPWRWRKECWVEQNCGE